MMVATNKESSGDEVVPDALRRALPPDTPLVVALSGGLDSCVLLHALRFRLDRSPSAAHFDHGMRPRSGADAEWVRGLCRAWGVDLAEGTVAPGLVAEDAAGAGETEGVPAAPPASEARARQFRYAFLRTVATRKAGVLLTAHHADDQAETVLFRALRGTGIEGLAGIPRRRTLEAIGGRPEVEVVRPLLDVWREDLEAYAHRHRIPWREDPTNESLGYARNALRNRILPEVEERVAPGARRSLVRLAEIAGREEEAWAAAMPLILPAIDARRSDGAGSCDRTRLLDLGTELAARVLRVLAADVGITLDHDATGRALDFIAESQSGRRIELGRGVELRLEGSRVVVVAPARPDTPARGDASPRPERTSAS